MDRPLTRQWSEAMVNARGIEGTRVLQGLLSLTKKHPREALEKACEIALSHGASGCERSANCWLKRPRSKSRCPSWKSIRSFVRWTITAASRRRGAAKTDGRRSVRQGFVRHDEGVQWRRESKATGTRKPGAS